MDVDVGALCKKEPQTQSVGHLVSGAMILAKTAAGCCTCALGHAVQHGGAVC